ncbi:MAG: AAA family ATPase [Burkholderiaceae bacterium]|nr:AAA family ATPase [Burkholderiaceae bacterium]
MPPVADRIEIRMLGGFAVTTAGHALADTDWPSLRAMHLVQLLCLAEHRKLRREQVMDALWPQLEPEAAAANMRKAAHHARRALGRQDAVLLRAGEVLLCPTLELWADVQEFETQAAQALASGDIDAGAAAASLYGGDLLPGAVYEAWTEPARERLRSQQLELLRLSGQWEALARLEPTDEPAHRELMAQALAAGNRTAAIHWYGHLRSALRDTLGVAPDARTEAMYRHCVDGLEPTGPSFVGRELTRAQFAEWLASEPRLRPGGVTVAGPGGIGKSALFHEVADLARKQGWIVVHAHGIEPGRPYAAVAAAAEQVLLEDRAPLETIGMPAQSALALLTPLAAPADEIPGPLSRHQVIGAFRRLLVATGRGSPVLLQIDDAHRLDDADVDVLMHLISAGPPVLVMLALRPLAPGSALGRGIARLVGAGRLRALELGPLDDDSLRALVGRAGPARVAPEIAEHIVRQAQGNPFAALELARCAAGRFERLPSSVAEAIMARLCDISVGAQALMRQLALAGDAFGIRTAEALADDGTGALAELDEVLQAGVLVMADTHYRFRHELVRQALIDQIPPHQQLRMNRDAAKRLAGLGLPPALVAQHWLAGGSPKDALPYLLTAAQDALRLAAFTDTLRHLEPVLDLEPQNAQALRLRAEALDALGDPAAIAAYRRAAELTGGPLAQDLLIKGALAQVKQGDPRGGLRALEGLRPSTTEGRLCEALAYSGAAALGATDPAVGTRKSAEARRVALESADEAALVVASWAQAAAAHARGELHQSVWADLQDTRHLPHLAVRVFDGQLCILQRFLYGARPYPEVIAFAEGLAREGRRIGSVRGEAFGTTIRGEAELLAGDLDAAEAHLVEGARMHRDIGAATGEAFSLQRLAEVAMYRGDTGEARERLDAALDLARQTDIGFHLLDRIYGTRVSLATDARSALYVLDEAREAVRGPLETCPGCRITFAVPAAIAAARGGAIDLAEELETQTAYLADVVMRLPAWYAAHDEVRGHLAAAKGDPGDTRRGHFAAAAARFRAAGQPLDAARCDAMADDSNP